MTNTGKKGTWIENVQIVPFVAKFVPTGQHGNIRYIYVDTGLLVARRRLMQRLVSSKRSFPVVFASRLGLRQDDKAGR